MRHRFFQHGCLAAGIVLAAGLLMTGPVEAQNYAAGTAPASTPHMPDGRPNFNGMWWKASYAPEVKALESGDQQTVIAPSRRCGPTEKGPDGIDGGCYENTNQQADGEFTGRLSPNRPLYKPEYWDKVQDLDYNTNMKDPALTCDPIGLPRIGPPQQIIQNSDFMIFLYSGWEQVNSTTNVFRVIPIGGQGQDPESTVNNVTYFGTSMGRWEGDTLVIESTGFIDKAWIEKGGYFHSEDMKVTERLKREGDTIHYQVTVEDPRVLLKPWVMNDKTMRLNPDRRAHVQEGAPCTEFDLGFVVSRVRH